MMTDGVRHIDLTVPKGWNLCTREQLELIIGIYLRRFSQQDRYHPFDPLQWKTECFFALAGLEIMDNGKLIMDNDDEGEATFIVRQKAQPRHEPFPIHVWQVHSFVEQHLKWLDNFNQLLIFPYKRLGYDWRDWRWNKLYLPFIPIPLFYPSPQPVEGPDTLMQDFSWQEYRFAQQYLDLYTRQQDLALRKSNAGNPAVAVQLLQARTDFLTAIFRTKHAVPQLRKMKDYQFQLILIYWQSVMHYIAQKFPKCFTVSSSKRIRRGQQTPLDLYVRSIATLEKYLGQSEEQINRKMFYANLQHLEDMAREAEELERISRKNKGKH